MKRVAIVGASGHGKVVVDILNESASVELVGFLDPHITVGEIRNGFRVLGTELDILTLRERHQIDACIIGVGDNAVRARIASNLAGLGFNHYVNAIHPSAVIARDVPVGAGVVVCAGACVNTGSTIGHHVLLNTNSSVDHDCQIGDFSSVAPGAVLGGGCRLGDWSAVGIGAVVKHSVSIGKETVIGAGALVLNDIEDNVVAYGCPARIVRNRRAGDTYLG